METFHFLMSNWMPRDVIADVAFERPDMLGEREFASLLRENGFDARRGQQFAGGADSPDVVSDALAWLHVEVKRVQTLNLTDACVQAEGDCGRGAPLATRSRGSWRTTAITRRGWRPGARG